MKRAVAVCLILLLLLSGCGRRQAEPDEMGDRLPPRLFIAGQLNTDATRMIFRLSTKQQGTLGGVDPPARTIFEIDTEHRLVRINRNAALDDLRFNDLRSSASYPCGDYLCCLRTSDDQPITLSRIEAATGARLDILFPKMYHLASGRVACDETGRLYFLAYHSTRFPAQRTAELLAVDLSTGKYSVALTLEAGRSNYRLLAVRGASLLVEERRLPESAAGTYADHLAEFDDIQPQMLEISLPDGEQTPYTGKWYQFGLEETNYIDTYTNELYYTGGYIGDSDANAYVLNLTTQEEARLALTPLYLRQTGGAQQFRQDFSYIPVGASPSLLLLRVGYVDWADYCESFPIYACITREDYRAGDLARLELLDYSAIFPGFHLALREPAPDPEAAAEPAVP